MIDAINPQRWIDRGQPITDMNGNPFDNNDLPYRHFRLVSVRPIMTAQGDIGTEIQWDTDHAKPESLQYVADNLASMPAPYFLHFYKLAWFAERIDTAGEAADRIEYLQRMHNLVPISNYIEAARDPATMPGFVVDGMKRPDLVGQQLVLSRNDPDSNYPICSVGARSPLGKMMGIDWIKQQQFETDHRLAHINDNLSSRYTEVSECAATLFDECLALIPAHGHMEAYWLRYHRTLFPIRTGKDVIIASWCMQGETRPDLIAPFGRPGYEVPVDT